MSAGPPVRRSAADPVTVRVDFNGRGAWEVVVPGRRKRATCATLDEASGAAYRFAARQRPCEVIVRDAYHRVLRRELIGGRGGATDGAHGPASAAPPR